MISFFCFLFIYCLSFSLAHNWVSSSSRASQANFYRWPSPARVSPLPHVQVQKNVPTNVQIEWSTGHGDLPLGRRPYIYFVLLPKSAEPKMGGLTYYALREYVAGAPTAALSAGKTKMRSPKWCKKHRQRLAASLDDPRGKAGFFQAILSETHEQWLDRPASWPPIRLDGKAQVSYKPENLVDDLVLDYRHSKYPHFLKVWRFRIEVNQPLEWDFAQLEFPALDAAGDYYLQYHWGSFTDIVDVNVVDMPVSNIWGDPPLPGTNSWMRIDHCYYPTPLNSGTCQVLDSLDDLSECLQLGRTNVQISPLALPDSHPFHDWYETEFQSSDKHIIPWFRFSGKTEIIQSCGRSRQQLWSLPDRTNKYVCIDITPRLPDSTTEEWEVTNDPAAPGFYSTCFRNVSPRRFVGLDNFEPPVPDVQFRYEDKCLPCDLREKYAASLMSAPVWSMVTSDLCHNCDEADATKRLTLAQ